jgi:hypothetical protein
MSGRLDALEAQPGSQQRHEGGSAISDDALERRSDAELRRELQRQLGRLARLMDDGTIDDPAMRRS